MNWLNRIKAGKATTSGGGRSLFWGLCLITKKLSNVPYLVPYVVPFAVLLTLAGVMPAGATGFIGKVTKEDGTTALSGVLVEALNPADDSVVGSTTTIGDGTYPLLSLAPGTYHVRTGPAGYFPSQRFNYAVGAGDTVTLHFALQASGEAYRDDFSVITGWSGAALSSNGNVMKYSTVKTGYAGNYDIITKSLGGTFSSVTYPFVSIRNKLDLNSGGIQTVDVTYDNPGPWNLRSELVTSATQSTPWHDVTYAVTYSWTQASLINDPDDVSGGNMDHYLDHLIIHTADRGYVGGQVKDPGGNPMADVRVELLEGGAKIGEVLTDSGGNYAIWAATTAVYTVRASKIVGSSYSNVTVAGRTLTTVNITLESAGCGYGKTVAQSGTGDYSSIQAAVNALPASLSTNTCVVIRDTATYSEQVTVQGFTTNGYRLKIMTDPAFASSAPVVNPPVASTAAFRIMNDSVTVQGINVISTNPVAYGILASSSYVTISSLNVDNANNKIYATGIRISSFSSVVNSSITAGGAHGLYMDGTLNTVSDSTMTGLTTANFFPLYINGGSSNTVTRSYISNPSGDAARIESNANYNTISQSTITSNLDGYMALSIGNASSNTITQSRISNPAGWALYLDASYNTISFSTITGNSADAALTFNSGTKNTLAQSYVSNPMGRAADISGSYNMVSQSTITGSYGLFLVVAASATITDSYLQGSTALDIQRSTGSTVNRSVLAGTTNSGVGLRLSIGSVNLSLSTNTLSGGSQGAGVYLEAYNFGVIVLSSNTITGGKYGLNIAAQNAGAALSIASMTFSSLTTGATAINFLDGTFVSTFTGVNFADPGIAVNINGSMVAAGSRITMRDAFGPKAGPGFENDPNNFVDWAPDIYPPNVVTNLAGVVLSSAAVKLTWTAPGDDAIAGVLNNSTFTIQYATYTSVAWSTSSAQTNISTTGVNPGTNQYYTLGALSANTSYYFRLWAKDEAGNYSPLSNGATAITLANTPPEIAAWTAGPNNAGIWWSSGGNSASYGISAWAAAPGMPAARYGHAVTVSGDRVFISGGTDGTSYKAEVWSAKINPDGTMGVWAQTASLPAARYGHTMAALKGRLYAIGGYNGSAPQSTVWSAAVSSYGTVGQWETADPLPQPRYGHGSAVGTDIIYVSGGYSAGARTEMWHAKVSDDGSLGGWTVATPLPEARYFHSMFLAGGGRLYVSGGYDGTSAQSGIWSALLNPDGSAGSWIQATALPNALYGHAMVEAGGSMFVSGGTDGSNARDGVWRSPINADGSLNGWEAAASLLYPVQLHSMIGSGGKLLIFGGSDGTLATSDIWLSTVAGTEYFARRAANESFTLSVADTGWMAAGWYDFGGLIPNTTYYFKVKARSFNGIETGDSPVFSTVTFAAQPSSATFSGVGMASLQANWGSRDNPEGTRYEVKLSSNPAHTQPVASSDTVNSFAVFDGLGDNFTYYAKVRAYNAAGAYTAFTNLGSTATKTNPSLDFSSPTIAVNQVGDNTWRGSNLGVYDVDFADTGGSYLDKFQVRASTVPGGVGPFALNWSNTGGPGINLSSYTANWSLVTSDWSLLLPGTNYISVRASDNAGNSSATVDAFYILKDTTPPSITDNQAGESPWLLDDPGAVYNVDFFDGGSGLKTIQYSASTNQNSADANALGWTAIAQLSAGATAYTENWAVAFAALANLATNYISVRAVDVAGSTTAPLTSGVDVFKVPKFVSGPVPSITVPYSAYRSALAAVSGTASDALSHALAGSEISIKDISAGYWNGEAFLGVAAAWFAALGTSTWSYAATVPWANGAAYRIVARSSDTAGNYSANYSTVIFTFDGSIPSAAVLSPAAGSTVNSLGVVSGTSGDLISGLAALTIEIQRLGDNKWWNFQYNTWGNSPSTAAVSGTAAWSYSPDTALKANLASGASYYATVSAADNAVPANILPFGAAGSTFTFVDNTPPTAVSDLSASTGTIPGSIMLRWAFTGDDGTDGTMLAGGYKIRYSTEPGLSFSTETAAVPTVNISAGSSGSYELNGLIPAVVYYLRLRTGDDAGNWSELSNGATAQARPYPESRIDGHVLTVSSAGITGVLVEAFDTAGVLRGSGYTAPGGQGSYSLTGIISGSYTVRAAWSANDIISSVGKDGIAPGIADVDFVLSVTYELASISGQIAGYRVQAKGVRGQGREARVEATGVYVELYQGGRKIATAALDETGRFKIANLLPGKYTVKITGLVEGAKEINVQLSEGQNLEIAPLGTLLKKDKVYAFPNPASHSVTFHIESDTNPLTLKKHIIIFGIDGRVIREFSDTGWTSPGAGVYEFIWNIGGKTASGVYIYEVKVRDEATGDTAKTIKKLAIVR